MIVVDASAVLDLLLRSAAGDRVLERIDEPGETLHAPHLLDPEVLQGLRRYHRQGALTDQRAAQALDDFEDLAIVRYPHDVLTRRVWQLRHNVTAYDACYIALAEALDAPLLTTDRRLGAASGIRARVIVP